MQDADESEGFDQPPQLEKVLTDVVVDFFNRTNKNFKFALRIPGTPVELAKWWINLERKPDLPRENCQKMTGKISGHAYWNCPYIDYCVYTLKKFLSQDADFQDLIIDAKLNNFQWRGDDKDEFIRNIKYFHQYRKNPEESKQSARNIYRSILKKQRGS